MNRFKKFLLDTSRRGRAVRSRLKRWQFAAAIAIIGMMLIFTAQADNRKDQDDKGRRTDIRFNLTPASNTIGNCLPNANARVTVSPKEDVRGVDTLELKSEGLPANTTFAVFLTELPTAPFGAAEYVGDFTTNAAGRGSLRADTIVEEAFSTTLVGSDRVRKELNHVVIWFADPAADDICPGPLTTVVTPFDGDGEAGTAALSSRSFLPGAPLP